MSIVSQDQNVQTTRQPPQPDPPPRTFLDRYRSLLLSRPNAQSSPFAGCENRSASSQLIDGGGVEERAIDGMFRAGFSPKLACSGLPCLALHSFSIARRFLGPRKEMSGRRKETLENRVARRSKVRKRWAEVARSRKVVDGGPGAKWLRQSCSAKFEKWRSQRERQRVGRSCPERRSSASNCRIGRSARRV